MKVDAAGGKYRIVAEINMIPFIDIALVLLIVFMVMTPFLIRAQIKVDLPKVNRSENVTDDREAVSVQVDKSGSVYVDGEKVAASDLVTTLRRRLTHPQTQPLRIEADKDVPFRHVVVVLDAGKEIGAVKMGVGVQPDKGRKASTR
jgi:biopolymer transport protein TolR